MESDTYFAVDTTVPLNMQASSNNLDRHYKEERSKENCTYKLFLFLYHIMHSPSSLCVCLQSDVIIKMVFIKIASSCYSCMTYKL